MSLKLKALLSGIRCWRVARRSLLAIRGQVLRLDHPRRASAKLAPFDDAVPDHSQRRHDAHIDAFCDGFERHLSPLGPLTIAIDRNTMVTAKRADSCFSPAIAASSRLTGAIEKPRDLLVGHQARQLADQC